jgi:nitrite reductase/ring-hydroxylating ferredoxin subunit
VSERYAIARTADLAEGERLLVDVGGRSIGVFRVDGRYYALLNRCPHAGAELCRGRLVGTLESDAPGRYTYDADRRLIACPWHGWEFDISTRDGFGCAPITSTSRPGASWPARWPPARRPWPAGSSPGPTAPRRSTCPSKTSTSC